MISTALNPILKRPILNPDELRFVNPEYSVFVQMALELEDPKYMKQMLEKMKKATFGLYIKTDGTHFIRNSCDYDNVVVHQIPKEVKTLSNCCEWICESYKPSTDYALASIAADETRIVITSNHSVTDGDYLLTLINNLTQSEKSFKNIAPIPRDIQSDILKDEFDSFIRNKDQYISKLPRITNKDITHLNLQESLTCPEMYKSGIHFRCEMDSSEFSIYDKSTKSLKGLSEYLWTGWCMSINAKKGKFSSLGIGNCMDFRRMVPSDRVDFSYGNAYTPFFICVPNPSPKMTIAELGLSFRNCFNKLKDNCGFYKDYIVPFDFYGDYPHAMLSHIGPVYVRKPIKDIYLQCKATEKELRNMVLLLSYSKIKEDVGLNKTIFHFRFSPKMISTKNGKDIFETFKFFMKNIKPTMKTGDAFDQLVSFQKTLE